MQTQINSYEKELKALGLDSSTVNDNVRTIRFLPTGFKRYDDKILRTGGIPYGRTTEIFGNEGSGKTLTALRLVAMAQRAEPDKIAVYVDSEYTFDKEWAERQGVNLSKLVLIQMNESKETLLRTAKYIKSGVVSIVVLDSLGNLIDKTSLDNIDAKAKRDGSFDVDPNQVAQVSRDISNFIRAVSGLVHQVDCVFLVINQLRAVIGATKYQVKESTPGGKTIRFNYSLRIKSRKVSDILDGDEKIGVIVSMETIKSKVGGAYKTDDKSHLEYYFDNGIERAKKDAVIFEAVERGLVLQSGAWIKVYNEEGEEIGKYQGKANFDKSLEEENGIFDRIKESIENFDKKEMPLVLDYDNDNESD